METKVLTISALNNYIKHILSNDANLRSIVVVGEISNYKPHHSKHMYFTLKDNDSRIDSIMFASNASNVNFDVKNGDKVIVSGYIDVYPATGKYQLYATSIKLDGVGDLTRQFEVLKEKLLKEGLFEQSRKRALPKYPKKIGVITATSGAAIRDIVSTIERRYKLAEVTIFQTVVQGENGRDSIINSLNLASSMDLDVVIIGRGGGSIEDLWNFNEEAVIRKISEFDTPIISGVGHETDFTLCDFICDARAETPTAAAVMATPDAFELIGKLENVDTLLTNKYMSILDKLKLDVHKYSEKYFSDKLYNYYILYKNYYVNDIKRLDDALYKKFDSVVQEYNLIVSKDIDSLLINRIKENKVTYGNYYDKLINLTMKKLDDSKSAFEKQVGVLEQLSPLKILSRGYSISYSGEKIVKSVHDIKDDLTVVLSDGSVDIEIAKSEVKEK